MSRQIKMLAFLAIYFLIVAFFVINFNLGYSISMILYLFIPSVYFSLKNKAVIKQVFIYAFIFSMPAVFVFDYIAHVSNSWYVPSEIGMRVLGTFPVEEILWSFLFFYFILIIYHAFFVRQKNTKILTGHTKYLVYLSTTLVGIFLLAFFIDADLLIINNFYIILVSLFMIIPTIIFSYSHPKYIKKFILLTLVFILPMLIYEYSALKTGQWFFNGQHYVGWIHFFDTKFPIEEFLFMIFCAPGAVSFYEFFLIDKK